MKRLALLFLAALTAPVSAQIDSAPKVHARLIAERDAVKPGGTVTVALELATRPGWHTYWRNPGDAGAPTQIDWSLPQGWRAGAIQWPAPKALPVGPLMDYGYEGKPWLLVDVTAPATASAGMVTLKAHASWLVCAEVCVPEDGNLALPLNVGGSLLPPDPAFAAARAKLPVQSPWPMRYAARDTLDLFVQSPSLAEAHPVDVAFFPANGHLIEGSKPQTLAFADNGLMLRLAKAKNFPGGALDGVLELTSADGSQQALEVHAPAGAVPAIASTQTESMSLALALLFAFIGGLILNLMPCVLPVLAMKALALASHGGGGRHAAVESLSYGVGAIASFMSFGAAVVLLRAGGAGVGWGFQLQEPVAVGAFALLVFAVGLSLSGVFELPGFGGGDPLTRRGGALGAFFTGMLAVAVAAPCTAPFMAAALGFAFTQPEAIALAVFFALGLGFAAPFMAVGFSPRLLDLLPRPGAWMLRFKQALAFPMYGASVWLVWVLANEVGADGVALVLAAMTAFALAVWIWSASRSAGPHGRGFGALASLVAFLAALALIAAVTRAAPSPALARVDRSAIPHEPYSAAKLAELRAQHRAVFVNATAAWCITCLVNERVAFASGAVAKAFAKHRVACLIADWTRRDPEITRLLEAHGRDGVPLYLYFAPGAADAQVLPQILTEGAVLKALGS
ncbi:MAG: thioredoxin family protein [Alphaproteobacteria bacterium]|nr:thioredoxin family protein [Alphaproteobacteria bacterium]MBV9692642.1 thioredoxin family protein [Alphaproteobacteria bacterium]